MVLFPSPHLGLLNGWFLLAIYFVGLFITVITYPRDKRKKLFYETRYPKTDPRWLILNFGRIAAISFVATMIFTQLRLNTLFFYFGFVIYLFGYSIVIISLLEYKGAREDQLVSSKMYQVSRNPQWVGLVFVFLGTAVAVATWLHIVLLIVLVLSYHFQILLEEDSCIQLYGEDYKVYKENVPRYFLFI